MNQREIEEYLQGPYPVSRLSFRYGKGGFYSSCLEMEELIVDQAIKSALTEELMRSEEMAYEEARAVLDTYPIQSFDPQGDCEYFSHGDGKFDLRGWGDFQKYQVRKIEKQAFLRVFKRWERAKFKEANIGEFYDEVALVETILINRYDISPAWILDFVDTEGVFDSRLKKLLAEEQHCYFWVGDDPLPGERAQII
jgi:hypothetical protein